MGAPFVAYLAKGGKQEPNPICTQAGSPNFFFDIVTDDLAFHSPDFLLSPICKALKSYD
jgi:hypothetical protein